MRLFSLNKKLPDIPEEILLMKEGSLLSALSSARINAMVSSVETLHLPAMFVKSLNFPTLLYFIICTFIIIIGLTKYFHNNFPCRD
jgi:hypothetical protein